MGAARFTFRLASGAVVGPVAIHGAGGPIPEVLDARRRVQRAIERATEGRPLEIAEPRPGHVVGYRATAAGDSDRIEIDMRGATLIEGG